MTKTTTTPEDEDNPAVSNQRVATGVSIEEAAAESMRSLHFRHSVNSLVFPQLTLRCQSFHLYPFQ